MCIRDRRERLQSANYIHDLEKTISINKKVIESLIAENRSESFPKNVISSLNKENFMLQAQLQEVIKERNEYQSMLLITEQILQEHRRKEEANTLHMNELIEDFREQPDKKEFALQYFEYGFYKLLELARPHVAKDPKLYYVIKSLTADWEERRVSSVIEENARLKERMNKLEARLGKMGEDESTVDSKEGIVGESSQAIRELAELSKGLKEGLGNAQILKGVQMKYKSVSSELISTKKEITKLKAKVFELTMEENMKGKEEVELPWDDMGINKDGCKFFSQSKNEKTIELPIC
eukprot:TRINITY_DN3348_c0_g4_i2.p1 TRINITY_DN3348_c0_g4~~TRINITY_DN3348_c0_g4_i2.p1  ORF type:complete len:294 (-),score=79.10 TRINITY_DN3348_c0_g4_i2:109-990(-)